MPRKHLGEVQVGEDVAVDSEEGVVRADGSERVHDRAARAERLGLGDPGDRRVAAPSLDERVEGPLQVRAGQHDLVDAVARQVVEHVVEARPIQERDERFGQGLGDRAQACPLTADEHDGLHRVTCAGSARRG
jgi:hypothetical protein